ncbi:MAG: hypothetical protein OXH92_11915 [Bryobacterales bacterium]|nr:hypothetical protein [Bryobacterales bacterium]
MSLQLQETVYRPLSIRSRIGLVGRAIGVIIWQGDSWTVTLLGNIELREGFILACNSGKG